MRRSEKQQHAVCIPYPAQGHINPMLKLAKILHSKGFHITFVNTEFNHNRLLRSGRSLDGLMTFRFETIPDGLPQSDAESTQSIPELCYYTEQKCLEPFKELLKRLTESNDLPPVSCIVSDAAMFFTLDAAEELGIPEVLLWTASACGLLGYAQYTELVQLSLVPFKDEKFMTNGDLEKVLDWVTGMNDVRLRDIPAFIRTTDPDDIMLNFFIRVIHHCKRASAILFNSFDALETDALQSLPTDFPPLYTLGPLHMLLDTIEANKKDTKSIGSNLWKEDPRCVEWLNQYEPSSVVYVNFGSITVMSNEQLREFAWGLANTKLPFLWITRPDLVSGEATTVLPPEFLEETKDRGLIASWCNQEQVLSHPAVGGFLMHSGWNSTLESICSGVPMICWPFFAEQQTNTWFCCTKWGIGMEIDTNVKRSEVERQVRELMGGNKGKQMKEEAMKWKALAREAIIAPNGPSCSNLENLVTKVLSQK